MRPVATKFAVVSTMVSSTSMMSTNGMTLSVSKGRSSMCDLPFEHEHLGLAQQRVVDDHRYERDDEPHGGRLQRQCKPDHDLADVGRGVDAELVERQHDAQNGAEQSNIGRVGRDRCDDQEAPGQLELKRLDAREVC